MTALARTVTALRKRAAPKVAASGGSGILGARGGMLMSLIGGNGDAGVSVSGRLIDRDAALRIATYWRCAYVFSGTCGMLPVDTFTRTPAKGITELREARGRVLWGRPNPEVAQSVYWTTSFLHLGMHGNHYAYVDGDPRKPAALWPIDPRRVRVGRDKAGTKVYEIDGTIPERDIIDGGHFIHVPGMGDGLVGFSPLEYAREDIAQALDAREYGTRFFAQGSGPGGYLSTDQELTGEQAEELSDAWEEQHQGVENAHRLAVIGKGTKWLSTEMDPEKTQALLTRAFTRAELAARWGIPEHLVGAHDKQSSWGSGLEEITLNFLTFTIQNPITVMEQTYSDVILPSGQYMKFNEDAMLRTKSLEQAQKLAIEHGHGVTNADEWRDLLDRPRRADGKGGTYLDLPPGAGLGGGPENAPKAGAGKPAA